eukprot:13722219-Alexandrium_andersonii.AAC.1
MAEEPVGELADAAPVVIGRDRADGLEDLLTQDLLWSRLGLGWPKTRVLGDIAELLRLDGGDV